MPVVVVTPYKKYEVPHAAVAKSGYLARQAAASPSEIYLTEKFFTDMVMMNVVSFLIGRDSGTDIPKIEDDEVILATLLAASYLEINGLFQLYSAMITDTLKLSTNANEAREKLNIRNDFSFEEEATNAKEDPWNLASQDEDIQEAPQKNTSLTEGSGDTENEESSSDSDDGFVDDMTVSMMVDEGSGQHFVNSLYPSPFSVYRPVTSADIVQFVQPRKPVAPVPDDQARMCSNFTRCGAIFSTLNRKHHCRHCGRIFCGACSAKYISLPEAMNIYSGYSSTYGTVKSWIWRASSVPTSLYTGKDTRGETHRVCDPCYDSISEQEKLSTHIRAFGLLALELPLLKRAGTLCRNWRRAVVYCLSVLREIQYQLPTGQLSDNDKRQLWANRYHWAGHSKWLIQMLKAVDWSSPEDAAQAVDILVNHKRKESCWRMMCSRSCEEKLSPGDALLLLNEDMPNMEVRNYAIRTLASANDIELICFLPVLVHNLRHADPTSLVDFLLNKAVENEQICNDLFWALSTCSESKHYKRLYHSIQHKLIITLAAIHGEARAMQLVKGQDLIAFLEGIPGGITTSELQSFLSGKIDSYYNVPLPLPVDPLIKVASLEWRGVIVKQSATAPIVVPCLSTTPHMLNTNLQDFKTSLQFGGIRTTPYAPSHTNPPPSSPVNSSSNNNKSKPSILKSNPRYYDYKFMFKREDVRKDQIVLHIIRLMDFIIKKELKLDLNVLTYRVTPTSSVNGVLEMVPHAMTLFDIVKNYKNIQLFLSSFNGERQVNEVLATYMRSLAAWTVITHLLGVGDRHMDNIMITESGILFHIDYGFVLGKDPKPMAPNIRMSESMIDGMGGRNSIHYSEFKNLCAEIFLCLRRHTALFFDVLMVLAKADPPIPDLIFSTKYLEEELSKRFLPGHSEAEAKATIQSLIDQCDTLGQFVTDFLHTHAKEKTLSEGVNKVAAGGAAAWGAVSYFMSSWTSYSQNADPNQQQQQQQQQ